MPANKNLNTCLIILLLGFLSSPAWSSDKSVKQKNRYDNVTIASSKTTKKTTKKPSRVKFNKDFTLEEEPSIAARYDFSDDDNKSFFNLMFSNEPGDPVDYEEFYSIARMAFLFGYYDTALQYWLPLANIGYAKAQASLGWMYHSGKGQKQNYKKALKWYRKAAKQNHPIAQNNLGVLYEKGWGVKRNYATAAKWYKESAEWGYSYGQYNYGDALRRGRGVRRNKNESIYWLDLASLQGVDQANALLGRASTAISHDPGTGSTALKQKTWIMLKNPRYFTIQLAQGKNTQELKKFIKKSKMTGKFAYYVVKKDNKKTYNLIYGSFPSFTSAEQKLRRLPKFALKNKPWIRKYRNVQEEIKGKNKVKLNSPNLMGPSFR